MAKPVLILSAPVATRSGYGSHSRDIFESLLKMDKFNIKILSQRWGDCPMNALYPDVPLHKEMLDRMVPPEFNQKPDIWIQVTVPNEFQPVGKYNIGITAGVESTICAPELIEGLNRMNLVIVPSKFSKEIFTSTNYEKRDEKTNQKVGELKCNTPIEVIYEGADTSIYHETENITSSIRHELKEIEEDFCFLSVGHWLNGNLGEDRKNVGMLIKVFLETFKGDENQPALILKTSGATFSIMDKNAILDKIGQIKATVESTKPLPNIYLLHGELSDEEMNSLYNHSKVKAHITFTKGEGFGRPLLEASLSSKPIIATNWSGHIDFLHKDYVMLLSGGLTNVHETAANQFLIKESQWFTVNYDEASQSMRNIYSNYKLFKPAAAKQCEHSKTNFSLAGMHAKFKEVFDKSIPEFPDVQKIKLPKLKKITLPKKTR